MIHLSFTVTIGQDQQGLYVEGKVDGDMTRVRVGNETEAKLAAANLLAGWANSLAEQKPKVILQ